jgi:L-fucose isomerase
MAKARRLESENVGKTRTPVIGVFAPCDPRIDEASRKRTQNIIRLAADLIAERARLADGTAAPVVYSDVLVDGEAQADLVARQFESAGVNILVGVPDTWSFPQPTLVSLIEQFPRETPLNLTCGNSGPKPGVVFVHACSGAVSQYGRLVHINVGSWPDTGMRPKMTAGTAEALVDWCQAALAAQSLRGRRVVVLGHDSMGMETALAHVIPTRNTFGIEITRLDMKLLADMLKKRAYSRKELKELRGWIDDQVGKRLEIRTADDDARFNTSLAMYLICRDLMVDLNAVGGGFMSQLEWGSDPRGIPLPVADVMESLFNSTFDHRGRKAPLPYATEADVQGLLTMLFFTHLTGGNPPLFMDFRKVWEPWEIKALAKRLKVKLPARASWAKRGFVDGDNSGSASLDWAAKPGASVKQIMSGVAMPQADPGYFPGLGNSVTFVSPAGIKGIAGRLAWSAPANAFSLIWDEAETVSLPRRLSDAVCETSTPTWPHTFVVPKYATMGEYKQFAPANHFHMVWDLSPARLEYWMDMMNVLSVTPWEARPGYVEGTDRPTPLLYLISGGETATKLARARGR